jgi:acetolactate synthase-1/2/3 large subunit
MKVSDYIIEYLRDKQQIDTVFMVSGGGCLFLIDSLGSTKGIDYIATHHEQAAALAAEGYARVNNKLGACIVTSGPGGTNAITGTLCNWLDSIPVIYISGQVNKEMTTNYTGLPLRQLGDQEFNIVESVKCMTKYAVQVNDPTEIKYHLDKACAEAMSGRPGPVWLDIPLNVQSAKIDPNELKGFELISDVAEPTKEQIDNVLIQLRNAKKPLLIVGNGVRLSGGVDSIREFVNRSKIPTITAVNGNDIITSDCEYYYGRFGTHAQICANKLINEADFVLSIGSRLYIRQIGYNTQDFARNAYKVYVDIDANELDKPTLFPDEKIVSDAKKFIDALLDNELPVSDSKWISTCDEIKHASPKILDRHRNKENYVSNYYFIEQLSKHLPKDYHVITSDGSANVVTMQVLDLHKDQRLITNTGCAPMGYGLPAAIGASVNHKIVCLEGDGSLHLNVHELQTMKHYNLPIKLILLNNNGYLSIKISQKTLFEGRFVGCEQSSGVSFPNFEKLIKAYDLPYYKIENNSQIEDRLIEFLNYTEGPAVLEVFTDPEEFHEPKVMASIDDEGKFIPGKLDNIKWLA